MLERRLAHSQPYLLVFSTSDRFIAEYLGVMLVMHKSVSLKYALEGRSMRTEEVLSMHQLPVYLVLDKGHQNARENAPATNLQNKHRRSLDSPVEDRQHERPPEAVAPSLGPVNVTQPTSRTLAALGAVGTAHKPSARAEEWQQGFHAEIQD